MSQRGKRPNRSDDGSVPIKRRKRTAAEEEEAASLAAAAWQPRSNDLKSIYNRTTTEAPAELFRKDLISAMKLPDSEPLASNEYWVIVDQWKQEWERGVQVPVNPDSLPEPSVSVTRCSPLKPQHEFKLPKNKYIRITKDENFKVDEHMLSTAPTQAEAACSYDLDECDVAWLKILNSERAMSGTSPISEDKLERVIEQFELSCWDKIQSILRNEEGLGIEYDETVICDVCRSPDSEEGNEMVFCDSCNICVHQACYGITKIPEGQWLCCTCNIGQRPECVLCPNKGGAMKCTRSGQKWAHVSCALWIPEVSIGCVEKMEPITKISSIPASRWALICVLCRERVGACIQCSVKTCKTAYHVTCAFKHGLEMRAIIEDENADDGVKLRSYCEKHSKSSKKEKSVCSGSEDDDSKRKKRKDMTSEEKNQARAARLQEIEAEFYKHVTVKDVIIHLDIDNDALHYIYNYWKLKRKAGHNKPLLPPKSEDVDMLSHKREQADLEKMKMFVQLRQDLERVRNLCYMVSRREKLSRTFFRMREQTFHKQAAVLESLPNLPHEVVQSVIEANHGPSIYDRLYSHELAEDHTTDFDTILARIVGIKSPTDSGDERKTDLNGLFKDVNPYKKVYVNGSSQRRSGGIYGSSSSSAADSSSDEKPTKYNKENRLQNMTSEDEKPTVSANKKKTPSPRKTNNKNVERRNKRHSLSSRSKLESSSEDDIKEQSKKDWAQLPRSRLRQVERELGISGSDSDELMPPAHMMRKSESKAISSIYSDSDSSDASMKNDDKSQASDSQQNRLRTKAAVKEFSHKPSSKCPNKSSPENKKKNKSETKSESPSKKKDYVPSDLIVPQRQAAKKATENLKSTTSNRTTKDQPEEPNKIEEKVSKLNKPKATKIIKDTTTTATKDIQKDTIKKDIKSQQTSDVFDIEKEIDKLDNQDILAYVPQRQAAKKAAEHIKSGLGKPASSTTNTLEQNIELDKNKKDVDINKSKKEQQQQQEKSKEPARISENIRKSSSNSSSSSSSSSSSDSSSSSSSDSDDEPSSPPKSTQQQQQQSKTESLFSSPQRETTKRTNAKDWPFLDKGSKPAASSSSSDSSDTSRSSSPSPTQSKTESSLQLSKISPDKTRKSNEQRQTTTQREEPARARVNKGRPSRGRAKPSLKSSDRIGDADVRTRDLSDSQCRDVETERNKLRKGKSDTVADSRIEKEAKSNKLQSPVRKTDKKIKEKIEPEVSNLEKEILERKAGKQGVSKTKSTLDRLFGSPEKKLDKEDRLKSTNNKINKTTKTDKQVKSTVKENKEPIIDKLSSPTMKSPVKLKNIEEILVEKPNIKQNKEKQRCDDDIILRSDNSISNETHKINEIFSVHTMEKKSPEKSLVQEVQNRSIFSPPHGKDMLDFDNFDDGFGISKDDEIMKGPLTFNFGNTSLFKEDSKEDSARETLNLVEKLRMELSKKSTSCDVDDGASVASSTKNESIEYSEQVVPNSIQEESHREELKVTEPTTTINLDVRLEVSGPTSKPSETEGGPDYRYLSEPEIPLEATKDIPIQHHGLSDHSITAQGDERWVPPSDNYSNMPLIDNTSYLNDRNNIPTPQHYMQQYSNQPHHKNQSSLNILPSQIDLRLHEDTIKNQSPSMHDRRISQTPLIDPSSMDCMPSPSPYAEIHPQAKWADSEVMPNRRSSSSSASSSSSSCSRRNEEEDTHKMRSDLIMMNHPNLENIGFLPHQTLPFPNSLDNFPGFPETSQYVGPVSLFPPPSLNTQLPFPSTGPTMFPPQFGAPFPTPHTVIPPMPKPVDDTLPYSSTCQATFTSSQHNMALTAAMVNLPPSISKELESPRDEEQLAPVTSVDEEEPPPVQQQQPPSVQPTQEPELLPSPVLVPPPPPPISHPPSIPTIEQTTIETPVPVEDAATTPSPNVNNTTPNTNLLSSPSPSIKSNSSVGKKSPNKPTRSSARVVSQLNKSPSKSPGKSPRQEAIKSGVGRGAGSKRNTVKSNASRGNQGSMRGRGRGRGRGRSVHQNNYDDFIGSNTIHNKLVGTVYDFDIDDAISSDNVTDLKSMRERRKSIDIHERKQDLSSKETSQSPKFASPSQTTHKGRSINADLKELRPPTPVEETTSKVESPKEDNDRNQIFPDIVQPVLPGPVDMRTYSNNFNQQSYNDTNLLNAFASGTTDSAQVHDDDDEFEKELQTVLTAAKKPDETPRPEVGNIKVSLSDSRNQLKVKIKGPIANYSSSVSSLPPPTVDPNAISNNNSVSNNVISNNSVSMNSGTNLRRMRKKELLRQYWTQDMNMDDSSCTPGFNATPAAPPVNRTIITIPKAVASMTTIPTKDDYRDYRTGSDDIIETKQHRKETKSRPLSRELRQLDLSLDDENLSDRRRSVGGSASGNNNCLSTSYDSSLTNKRRGRPPRPSQQSGNTPKIKIKFGTSNIVSGGTTTTTSFTSSKVDDKKDRVRPPKKRLTTNINKPSVADFKRDCMKFRKLVMANFEEGCKKKKKDKGDKKKKKKSKPQVQIISNETQNPTKLIIRFGKKFDDSSNVRTSGDDEKNNSVGDKVTLKRDSGDSVNINEVKKKSCDEIKDESGGGIAVKSDEQNKDKLTTTPLTPPPPKNIPIKLKLARCQEGSYVMKTTSSPQIQKTSKTIVEDSSSSRSKDELSNVGGATIGTTTQSVDEPAPPPISLPDGVHTPQPQPLPLNKDCEVR